MADFADGIAPQRYGCRGPQARSNACEGSQIRRCHQRSCRSNTTAAYWSLDEGRWMSREPRIDHRSMDVEGTKETNSSIKFKQLIDRGFELLNFAKRRRELNEIRHRSEADAWERWTGERCNPTDRRPTEPRSEALKAARYLLWTADLRTRFDESVTQEKIDLLFQDDHEEAVITPREDPWLAAGGAFYFLPEVGDKLPLTKSLFRPPEPSIPRWLSIDWFKRSPYSPIQVEAIEDLPGPRGRWRAAFEDLMAASLGRPVSSNPFEVCYWPRNSAVLAPGIDWVFSLQTRSILPPLLPSLYGSQNPRKIEINMFCDNRRLDYQEFSSLVDEIWKSNRSSLNAEWYCELWRLCKQLPRTRSTDQMKGCIKG